MNHDDFDEGLVHGHAWAKGGFDRAELPLVAGAPSVNTPSSALHDDAHEGGHKEE